MELLAPAGNMEALESAVACGADAVYLGTKEFNARSKADNFSEEQLRLAVSYCHERGVRVYLTLNTLIKTFELSAAEETVRMAKSAGIDAILVQDLGLYIKLAELFPDVSFHTSTQMGVHNLPGAKMAEKLGFDRVVLARETLPADIEKIKKNTSLEIEMFVHGAHCVSFSGNCYFSAMVSGYSGNRGKCLQLCRKKYTLTDGKRTINGYLLSAKDICMLSELKRLSATGVDSLKIEGRLKSTEYVGTVCDVYKRALSGKTKPNDMQLLEVVFNRGNFSKAYIDDDRPDIIYPVQQNHIGLELGRVDKIKGNEIFIRPEYKANSGDGFKILRKGREVGSAICSGGKIICRGNIRTGDVLHLTKSASISEKISDIIKSSKLKKNRLQISQNLRKNHSTMSDIVSFPYKLPAFCKIIMTDEKSGDLCENADYIILSPSVYTPEAVKNFVKRASCPVLLDMPIEARGADVDILNKIVEENIVDGYVANNIYALEMCRDKKILLGMEMNSISGALNYPKIMSPEAAKIENNAVLYAYGRVTLMNLTHCPRKQMGYDCSNCNACKELKLNDENGNVFNLRRKKISYCYFELINSKAQNLLPKLSSSDKGRIIIDVRNVDPSLAHKIVSDPYSVRFDEKTETYGRFGKGVK